MDKTDEAILSVLHRDCRLSFRKVAQKLGIHPTTAITRIRKLEKSGVIIGYGARFDLNRLGYEFRGIVQIKIAKGKLVEVQARISRLNGVVAVYDVTGEYDAVAIVAAKSRDEFSRLIKSVLNLQHVEHTNTQVILNVVKPSWQFEAV